MFLPLNRKEDIQQRGRDCLVYDYNGSIVSLKEAVIWYSHDGNYMEPEIYNFNFVTFLNNLIKFC